MLNKQSIKQFLKPNKKKILVFAILGIILLLIPIIPCQIYYDYGHLESNGLRIENSLCRIFRCVLDTDIVFRIFPCYGCSSAVCPWGLIASIYILFYFLSCLIIYFYDKMRPKKS